MNLLSLFSVMDTVAWRGLVYTLFILHFVFACQLLLLQPLVSAFGNFFFFNSDFNFFSIYFSKLKHCLFPYGINLVEIGITCFDLLLLRKIFVTD